MELLHTFFQKIPMAALLRVGGYAKQLTLPINRVNNVPETFLVHRFFNYNGPIKGIEENQQIDFNGRNSLGLSSLRRVKPNCS